MTPLKEFFTYQRPTLARGIVAGAYISGTTGLLVLAFNHLLFDEWAITGAAIGTLVLLALLLYTGRVILWLGVAACWVYALIIEAVRGPNTLDRSGVSLIALAFVIGALGAYTAARQMRQLG